MFVSNKQPVYFIEPSMIQRFSVWTVIIYCEIVNMDLKSQNNYIDSIKFCHKGNVISTVSNIKILAIISHLMPCWTHFSFQLRHFKRLKLMITHICIFVRAVYYFFNSAEILWRYQLPLGWQYYVSWSDLYLLLKALPSFAGHLFRNIQLHDPFYTEQQNSEQLFYAVILHHIWHMASEHFLF